MKEKGQNMQKQQKLIQKTENPQRVSIKLYIKVEDSLKMEELMKTLKKRGWRKEKVRLPNLIMDELFLKADNRFYEKLLNKFTPLEYLFKAKIKNPALRREMEKILKKKV